MKINEVFSFWMSSLAVIAVGIFLLFSILFSEQLEVACTDADMAALSAACPISQQGGNHRYFSQYFEDYTLSIIFEGQDKGTYIDIGAYDPESHSVTNYFYLKGWRGINIEPVKELYEKFTLARSQDINLNIGLSNHNAQLPFYFIPTTGLSTFDHDVAKQTYMKKKFEYVRRLLPVVTLNSVLADYPLEKIDFVKIDVEGFERQVLEGIDLKKHRPQVFIVEAVFPRTHAPSQASWEPILLKNHYKPILFDGLNRYYLADENKSLRENFIKAGRCTCAANKKYNPFNANVYFIN